MNDTPDNSNDELWCPRRAEAPFQAPGPDRWDNRGGLVGQENIGLSCSYCGSLHPDTFMDLIRDGWQVEPTDKSYKAYFGRPLTEQERAARKTSWMNGPTGAKLREAASKTAAAPEEADAVVEEIWARDHEPYLASETVAKFYYRHLSTEQQAEFIELYNNGRMKISYPGRFYVPPFFTRPATADAE